VERFRCDIYCSDVASQKIFPSVPVVPSRIKVSLLRTFAVTPQCAATMVVQTSKLNWFRTDLRCIGTHFGLERDNFMVSKFTPTDEAFEHRAPYW
jgi:hypothetical protein